MWGTLASRYLLRKKLGEPFSAPLIPQREIISESYANAELDLPHQGIGSDAGDLAIARTAINAVGRLAKVNVIEHIEELSSELRVHPLSDAEVLEYGKIRIEEVRAGELVAVIAQQADLR